MSKGIKYDQGKTPWNISDFNYLEQIIRNKADSINKLGKDISEYDTYNPLIKNKESLTEPLTQEEIEKIKKAIPKDVFDGFIVVLGNGMKKYGLNNWKEVRPFKSRYFSALIRHLTKWWSTSEKVDPDFGQSHLAHAMCNLFFLMWGEKYLDQEDNINTEKVKEEKNGF